MRSMCRVLMVHFSGFYAWLKEPLSQRAQEDMRQTELIKQACTDSGKIYGYRKLADDLRDAGETRRQAEGAIFQYINGFYNPRVATHRWAA